MHLNQALELSDLWWQRLGPHHTQTFQEARQSPQLTLTVLSTHSMLGGQRDRCKAITPLSPLHSEIQLGTSWLWAKYAPLHVWTNQPNFFLHFIIKFGVFIIVSVLLSKSWTFIISSISYWFKWHRPFLQSIYYIILFFNCISENAVFTMNHFYHVFLHIFFVFSAVAILSVPN